MLNWRQRQKIRRYIQAACPVSLIAYALRVSEDTIRQEMGPELASLRLEKLLALSQVLDTMAMSQKSVTLSMTWFRLQLTQLLGEAESISDLKVGLHDEGVADVGTLSDAALHDEIHRLLTCDI
jgi:hypothetical protein